jgi:hypothetical protein
VLRVSKKVVSDFKSKTNEVPEGAMSRQASVAFVKDLKYTGSSQQDMMTRKRRAHGI